MSPGHLARLAAMSRNVGVVAAAIDLVQSGRHVHVGGCAGALGMALDASLGVGADRDGGFDHATGADRSRHHWEPGMEVHAEAAVHTLAAHGANHSEGTAHSYRRR